MTQAERRVMAALMFRSDERGIASPGQGVLRISTGLSVRQISRILSSLEAKGMIERVGYTGKTKRQVQYQIRTLAPTSDYNADTPQEVAHGS